MTYKGKPDPQLAQLASKAVAQKQMESQAQSGKPMPTMAQNYLVKPLAIAATGALGAKFTLISGDNSVPFLGRDMSAATAVFAALYGSSLLGQVISDYVTPSISGNMGTRSILNGLVVPAITGASTVGVWALGNNTALMQKGVPQFFVLGALADIAGTYIYEQIANPLLMK